MVENKLLKIFITSTKHAAKTFAGYDVKYIIKAHIARTNEPKVFCDSSLSKIKSQAFAYFLIYKIATACWPKMGVKSMYVLPPAF